MGKKYKRRQKGKRLRKVWSQNKPDDKRHAIGSIASHLVDEFNEKENAFAKNLDALSSGELRPAPGRSMIQSWQRRTGSMDKWFPIRESHQLVRFFCGWKWYWIKTDIDGTKFKSQVFEGRQGMSDTILHHFAHTIKWAELAGD